MSQYRSSHICPKTTVLFKSLYLITSYRKNKMSQVAQVTFTLLTIK